MQKARADTNSQVGPNEKDEKEIQKNTKELKTGTALLGPTRMSVQLHTATTP